MVWMTSPFAIIDAVPACQLVCAPAERPVAAVLLPSGVIAHVCKTHLWDLLSVGRVTYPVIEIVGAAAVPVDGHEREKALEVGARRLRLVGAAAGA